MSAVPVSSESALAADWRRCLQACYELIQEGVALFGSVADQHTCAEVAGSRQGAHYIDSECRPNTTYMHTFHLMFGLSIMYAFFFGGGGRENESILFLRFLLSLWNFDLKALIEVHLVHQ